MRPPSSVRTFTAEELSERLDRWEFLDQPARGNEFGGARFTEGMEQAGGDRQPEHAGNQEHDRKIGNRMKLHGQESDGDG